MEMKIFAWLAVLLALAASAEEISVYYYDDSTYIDIQLDSDRVYADMGSTIIMQDFEGYIYMLPAEVEGYHAFFNLSSTYQIMNISYAVEDTQKRVISGIDHVYEMQDLQLPGAEIISPAGEYRLSEPLQVQVRVFGFSHVQARIYIEGDYLEQDMLDLDGDSTYESHFFSLMDEGTYIVQAIAYDAHGNSITQSGEFTVKNDEAGEAVSDQTVTDSITLSHGSTKIVRIAEFELPAGISRQVMSQQMRPSQAAQRLSRVKLLTVTNAIKSIEFRDIMVDGDIQLGVEDAQVAGYEQAYSIDPRNVDFKNATVTVSARGTELYKCTDWIFSTQTCYGEWVLFKTGLVPGQEYTFTLTGEDPGFAEKLTILNVQSYPTVGGNWQVQFTTEGTADLLIRAVNGTIWEQNLTDAWPDLIFENLTCGNMPVVLEWINSTVVVRNYSCTGLGLETSTVLTTGAHYLEFNFGSIIKIARNKASDPYDNVSQIYAATLGQNGDNPVSITLDGSTVMHTGYNFTPSSRLYVNETDLYKISYGCTWVAGTASDRLIMENWVRKNGVDDIIPSKQSCFIRDNINDQDTCSNSGVLLADLIQGDYLELMGDKLQGAAGTVLTTQDCWMYAQRVRNQVAQVYDNTGGDDFNGTTISISLDGETYIGSIFSHENDQVNITESGWYKVYYHACSEDIGQNSRMTVQTWLRKNANQDIAPSDSFSYIRQSGIADRNCEQGYLLLNFTAGDYIELRHAKRAQEGGGVTVTLTGQSWLLLEKAADASMIAYESAGGQTIASGGNAAINLDTNMKLDSIYSHSPGTSAITVNRTGLFEVSYGMSWADDLGGDRIIVCGHLEKNGSSVSASRQCDYTRGDPEARWGTVAGNIVLNITKTDYIQLIGSTIGSAADIEPGSTWISIVRLDTPDRVAPLITGMQPASPYVNDSWPYINVTFNCTATDNEELASIALYLTDSHNQTFAANKTSAFSDTIGQANWTLELGIGNYSWSCRATDATGNTFMAPNRSVILNFTDTTPPWFDQQPKNRTVEYGDPFSYDLNASDNLKVDSFMVNDSNFNITKSGHLQNKSPLFVGIYYLNVSVNDTWGNVAYSLINITVLDTTAPVFTVIANTTEQESVPLYRQLEAYDLSGIKNWTVNDSRFSISSTGELTNASAQAIGTYWLNISVFDIYDNIAYKEMYVNFTNVPDTKPPWFDPVPTDQEAEYAQEFIYDVDAVDDYQIDTYWLNDSRFNINWYGVISNSTHLPVGYYYLNISVNDTSSNMNYSVISVNVRDTLAPLFTAISNLIIPYNISLSEQFNATDPSGISVWSVNDSLFTIDNTGLLHNASLLGLGYHWLNITVNDSYGNMANETIYVHVIDIVDPWFHPALTDIYIEFGSSLSYDINASDDVAVDSYYVNDSMFNMSQTGLLYNLSGLGVGTYSLEIAVNDTSGNLNSSKIKVYVSDTISPEFTDIFNITAEFYSNVAEQFSASDLSGISNWSEDHEWFSISSSGLLTSDFRVPAGEYWIIVTAFDPYYNSVSRQVLVNVTDYTGRLGWFVQQGEARMGGADTYVDINKVRTDHAFIMLRQSAGGTYDEPDQAGIWAEFVNGSRIVLHQGIGAANSNYVGWQVIENPNLNVQHYNMSFATTDSVINFDLENSVDTSKTVVFIDLASSASNDPAIFDQTAWTAQATSSTNVRLQRDSTGTIAGNLSFFVVEFNEGSSVQSGEISNVGGLGSPSYIDVQKVNVNESWVYFSHASSSAANGLDDFGVRISNVNSTRWEALREATGGTKRIIWYVIETPGANVQRGTIPSTAGLSSGYYPTGGYGATQQNLTALMISWYNTGAGTTFSNYFTAGYIHNATHWYMRREATGNSHSVSWEVIEFPEYGVIWNQSQLYLGANNQSEGNISRTVTIYSQGSNKNTVAICTAGNCSSFVHNLTATDLDNNQSLIINFTCIDSFAGNLSAVFSLFSTQDPVYNDINVSCEMVPNPSYQTYYGNASAQIKLGIAANALSEYGSAEVKNIYVADADSTISWSSLQAIGLKKDNTSSSNDFLEIDALLNISHKFDSVRRLWAIDPSTAGHTMNIKVYGRLIQGIPVINSTNSSSFVTGILWDTSDSPDNEFDAADAEDLVFMTVYSEATTGKYGTYGYEIKVPENIVYYKGSVNFTSVEVEAS